MITDKKLSFSLFLLFSSVLLLAAPTNARILVKLKTTSLVMPRKKRFDNIKDNLPEITKKLKFGLSPKNGSNEDLIDTSSL